MPDHLLARFSELFNRLHPRLLAPLFLLIVSPFWAQAQPQPAGAPSRGTASAGQPTTATPPASNSTPLSLPTALPESTYRSTGRVSVLNPEQYSVVNGGDVVAEYGLERVVSRHYATKQTSINVEVFEMHFPAGAYGLSTFNRRSLGPNRIEFISGKNLISVSMENPTEVVDPSAVQAVEKLFPRDSVTETLPIIAHLPSEKKIEGSERYVVGPVALSRIEGFSTLASSIDFNGGVEVAIAEYQTGNGATTLAIIEYHTPQSASAGYETAFAALNALAQSDRDKRILKRVGNYVIEAITTGDVQAARAIVDQVKYEVRIYWEGKKLSSIPLEYRPADPAAIEEMQETATVLLRTFYGIGLMLLGAIVLGIFAGWSIFYWRKQKRRKLGKDDYFSDAGETVRLNLDDYIFQPAEQPIKLLGKGDA